MIIAGVALFVAAPLGIGLIGARAKSAGELQAERHEHERALAVQALRELEFDREMGKLSDADYESMHAALEDRALTAMTAIENIRTQADAKKASVTRLSQAPKKTIFTSRRIDPVPTLSINNETARPAPTTTASRGIRYCPQCGTRAATDAKFCAQCGIAIKPDNRAVGRTD